MVPACGDGMGGDVIHKECCQTVHIPAGAMLTQAWVTMVADEMKCAVIE